MERITYVPERWELAAGVVILGGLALLLRAPVLAEHPLLTLLGTAGVATLAWQLHPRLARPVLLRAEHDLDGDDFLVWLGGACLHFRRADVECLTSVLHSDSASDMFVVRWDGNHLKVPNDPPASHGFLEQVASRWGIRHRRLSYLSQSVWDAPQKVLVTVPLAAPEADTVRKATALGHGIRHALAAARAGCHHGVRPGTGADGGRKLTLSASGISADTMYRHIRPLLEAEPWLRGATVTLDYGRGGRKSVTHRLGGAGGDEQAGRP